MANDEVEDFDGSNVTNGKVSSLGLCSVCSFIKKQHYIIFVTSGNATLGHARSNNLAERSTNLAPPCILLCFGISVNRK